MRLSTAFTTTQKTDIGQGESNNYKFLIRGGFIRQLSSGIYTYLPLGLKVLNKISQITREEMNALGAEEVLMPTLHQREYWERTNRYELDVSYRVLEGNSPEPKYVLGWTHEEIVTPLAKDFIHSYKDLPKAVYQIQTKFRNEPRPKSGLLRGKEFLMKDLYSFHVDSEDLERYYPKVQKAYFNVYKKIGLKVVMVQASGGPFSQYSHEFQALCANGEDKIFYCNSCSFAQNEEITKTKEGNKCPQCEVGKINTSKAIEVGNIFKLGDRFSKPLNLVYTDQKGNLHPVIMASYGIGISRIMGAVAEIYNDSKGIIWPKSIAPADIHLVSIRNSNNNVRKAADNLYEMLKKNFDVLYDDRDDDVSAGEKLADADLIGAPIRLVISPETVSNQKIELKQRANGKIIGNYKLNSAFISKLHSFIK